MSVCVSFVLQGGFEVFVSDLPRVAGDGDHDKERKWKHSGEQQDPGAALQTCFWLFVGWAMLVWDEIGRARASVSADASSRALVLQPCERHTLFWGYAPRYGGRLPLHLIDRHDTLFLGTRVSAEKKKPERRPSGRRVVRAYRA